MVARYLGGMPEDTVAMTLRLPPGTYERLRKAAFDGRTSMNAIVVRATEAELEAMALDSDTPSAKDDR